MKTSIIINGTEREVLLTILPSGCGHNKIIAYWFDGESHHEHVIVTNNTLITDSMQASEYDEERADKAKSEAAEMIIEDFNSKAH